MSPTSATSTPGNKVKIGSDSFQQINEQHYKTAENEELIKTSQRNELMIIS